MNTHILCPGRYFLVIVFVRRNIDGSVLVFDTCLAEGLVAFHHIVLKLFAGDQQRITVFPRHVQQMSVTVAAYKMPFVEQAFHYIGIEFIELSGKEEATFDAMLLQGADDGIGTVCFVGGSEYEGDLLF